MLQLALSGGDSRIIHFDLDLKAPKTLMIVSGPNAGGKTVALKPVGIAVLMKWRVPILLVTRLERLFCVRSDLFILGTPGQLDDEAAASGFEGSEATWLPGAETYALVSTIG